MFKRKFCQNAFSFQGLRPLEAGLGMFSMFGQTGSPIEIVTSISVHSFCRLS